MKEIHLEKTIQAFRAFFIEKSHKNTKKMTLKNSPQVIIRLFLNLIHCLFQLNQVIIFSTKKRFCSWRMKTKESTKQRKKSLPKVLDYQNSNTRLSSGPVIVVKQTSQFVRRIKLVMFLSFWKIICKIIYRKKVNIKFFFFFLSREK